MTEFLLFRERVQDFYQKQDYWLLPLFRALFAVFSFFSVNAAFGHGGASGNPLLLLLLSGLCFFLPWGAVPLFAGALILADLYRVSLFFMLAAAFVFLMILLFQTAFRGGHAELIALVPLLFGLKIPYLAPALCGLFFGLMSFAPLALGTFSYYFLRFLAANAGKVTLESEPEKLINQMAEIFLGFFEDRGMLLMIFSMVIAMLLIYTIRNMSFRNSWYTALGAGFSALLLFVFAGSRKGLISISAPGFLLSLLFSAALSCFLTLFFHDADFRAAERLSFEDDEYFYYVKAVPKRRPPAPFPSPSQEEEREDEDEEEEEKGAEIVG